MEKIVLFPTGFTGGDAVLDGVGYACLIFTDPERDTEVCIMMNDRSEAQFRDTVGAWLASRVPPSPDLH